MRSDKTFSILLAAAGAVVAWRVTALALAHGSARAGWSPLVPTLLALVGIAFPICGLLVFRKHPSRATLIFAGFSICAGLHWGGPLELPPGELRTALLLFYVLVSSFLSETLLLHFTLSFPRELRLVEKRPLVRLLYAPTVAATLLAAIYFFAPTGSSSRAAAESTFFVAHAIVSNLFAVLALAIFVVHLIRSGLDPTEKRYVGLMVAGMLTAWLPYLVASAVGAETDPWHLTMVALPVAFAIGIPGIARARARDDVVRGAGSAG